MTRTASAIAFLRLASSGEVTEAYAQHIHADFRHHNPYFKGDRESLQRGMQDGARQFPDKTYEALRTVEQGDLVAVHGRVRLKPDGPWVALIHIFRFQDGLIIEEWEAAQEVPADSPNENGVF